MGEIHLAGSPHKKHNGMNYEEGKQRGHDMIPLAEKGTEIIAILKNFLENEGELNRAFVVESEPAERSLSVSYFGLSFVFRIEVIWKDAEIAAQVAAYALTYEKVRQEIHL